MGYLYVALWAIVAIYLIVKAHSISPVLYGVGAFFAFMSIWWLVNELLPDVNLFDGIYGIIFRVVTGVVLLALILIYILSKKKKSS